MYFEMIKIMIVDDAVFIRKVLKGILIELGYEIVAEASTGRETIQMLENIKPDIVTLDITLPDMSGIDILKEIKKLSPQSKVIMISALSDQQAVMEALKYGAINYISKPFSKEKIEQVLKAVEIEIKKNAPLPVVQEEKVDKEEKVEEIEDVTVAEQPQVDESILESEDQMTMEKQEIPSEEKKEEIIEQEFEKETVQEESIQEESTVQDRTEDVDAVANQEQTEHIELQGMVKIEREEGYAQDEYGQDEDLASLEEIRLVEEDEDYVLIMQFDRSVSYNFGKMKVGTGFIFDIENCRISTNVASNLPPDKSVIDEIKLREIANNVYIAIKTSMKKFSICENEKSIEIALMKEKGIIDYQPSSNILTLRGVAKDDIEIEKADEGIIIHILSKNLSFEEGRRSYEDDVIEFIEVAKSFKKTSLFIKTKCALKPNLIEQTGKVAIKFEVASCLTKIDVRHEKDISIVELLFEGSTEDISVYHEKESGRVCVYFPQIYIPDEIKTKEFDLDRGFIEKIEFVEDEASKKMAMVVYTPVNRVYFTKDDNRILITCRANKVYLLYDNLQKRIIFQNIKPTEIELIPVDEKNIYFRISNRFIVLIKDSMAEENDLINKIEVLSIHDGYEGNILLNKKCSYYSLLAKDKVSTEIYLTQIKAKNKVRMFEISEEDEKTILFIGGEGELKGRIEKLEDDKGYVIYIEDAALEGLLSEPLIFDEGCIEKLQFKQIEDDRVEVYISSSVENAYIEEDENGFKVIFELRKANISIEENRLIVNGVCEKECTVKYDKENYQLDIIINRRDIYMPLGLFKLEDDLIKSYQVYRTKSGYGILVKLFKKVTLSLESNQDENTFVVLLCKYPEINSVEVINKEENISVLSIELDDIPMENVNLEKVSSNIIELYFSQVDFSNLDLTSRKFETGLIKSLEFLPHEDVLKMRMSFEYSHFELLKEKGRLELVFERLDSQVIVEKSSIFINNVATEQVKYQHFKENGVIIVEVPKTGGYLTNTLPQLKDNKVIKYINIEHDSKSSRIYIIGNPNLIYDLRKKDDEFIIEMSEPAESKMISEIA